MEKQNTTKTAFKTSLNESGTKPSFKLPILFSVILGGLVLAGMFGYLYLQTQPIKLVNNQFENQYISATIPKGWNVYRNEPGDADLIVYLEKENGIANISVDHDQYFLNTPNSATIKKYGPKDILDDRLKSLAESIETDPNAGWEDFRRAGELKETTFKGLPAAEGDFVVFEKIFEKNTERQIKRIVIFSDDDLYNIVFAATDITKFQEEEKEFNEFMDGLIIK